MWHLDLSSNYQKHLSKKNSVSADLKDNIRFKPKGIWGILLTASFSTATSMMIIAPLVIMLLQDKFNAPFYIIAMTYIPMGLVWVFTPKYIVKFINRYGKLAVMAINLIASAISMLFIPIVPALWILALIWAITAMFDVGGNIAEQSRIADLTNNNHYGKGLQSLCIC